MDGGKRRRGLGIYHLGYGRKTVTRVPVSELGRACVCTTREAGLLDVLAFSHSAAARQPRGLVSTVCFAGSMAS
jgi:hypothetical protein